ncbi:MAG TPA: hypothetical protein VF840_06875 [Terriglobales bacterium]
MGLRGDGAGLLLGNFLLSAQPIIEIVTICPAAFLVEFIRALSDLFFEILGMGAGHYEGLAGRMFGHGETPCFLMAAGEY